MSKWQVIQRQARYRTGTYAHKNADVYSKTQEEMFLQNVFPAIGLLLVIAQ
jgi:hypothetical protein